MYDLGPDFLSGTEQSYEVKPPPSQHLARGSATSRYCCTAAAGTAITAAISSGIVGLIETAIDLWHGDHHGEARTARTITRLALIKVRYGKARTKIDIDIDARSISTFLRSGRLILLCLCSNGHARFHFLCGSWIQGTDCIALHCTALRGPMHTA